MCRADRVFRWECKRSDDGRVRGQHRLKQRIAQALPRKVLPLPAARFAVPLGDAEKIEPHGGVRIGENPRQPRPGAAHFDAEFFVQLARKGLLGGLAGFDLAAGKLPPAGIHLAGRALREQEGPIGAQDHRRGDLDDHAIFSVLKRARPTRSHLRGDQPNPAANW